MLAFVLKGNRARLVSDRPRPQPVAGQVRVRMRLAGICKTDLELVRGYMGFEGVLGHEFVGEALDGRLAGRRVVGEINFACHRCTACGRGLERHCPNRRVLGILDADGALAEEFLMPEENLIEVPENVRDESAVFVEPLAAACEILEQLGRDHGRLDALVLGDGKLGPLIAQVLATQGFAVSIVGRHVDRLDWLSDRGVSLHDSVPAGARYRLVVEATGTLEGLRQAIDATEPRGTLILKTTIAGEHSIDLAPLVINEISMVGSRCGRFEPALKLLAEDRVSVENLIDARYPLVEAERAFATASQRGTRKVIVEGSA